MERRETLMAAAVGMVVLPALVGFALQADAILIAIGLSGSAVVCLAIGCLAYLEPEPKRLEAGRQGSLELQRSSELLAAITVARAKLSAETKRTSK